MLKTLGTLGMVLLVVTVIVMAALAFLWGPTHPLPWVMLVILIAIPFIYNKFFPKKYVEWNDDYSVGIEAMDNDHKKLLNLINQLQTATDYYTGQEFEKQAFDELVDYTKTHFAREEALLEENNYEDLEAHKEQHRLMIAKVNELVKEYENNSEGAISNALEYLKNWLIRHINGTDKEYGKVLNAKGVK